MHMKHTDSQQDYVAIIHLWYGERYIWRPAVTAESSFFKFALYR